MDRKYIFFDIDGTLTCRSPGGSVLPSTVRTLEALRENGHFTAIATGRAMNMSLDFAASVGIDNIVSDGGHGLRMGGDFLGIEPLDPELVRTVLGEAEALGFGASVALSDGPVLHTKSTDTRGISDHPLMELIVVPDMDYQNLGGVYKISIRIRPEEEHMLPSLGDAPFIRYHDTNLIIEPDDKFKGILKMVNLAEGDPSQIVVFGDGNNDISMFRKSPMSVAMGNAIDELKEIATFVTKRNDDDGIEYACRHFGWI